MSVKILCGELGTVPPFITFFPVYQQEEFLSLSVERLTEVLSSDHLNVPQEEDMVFEAAMMWLDKCPTHQQSFGQVRGKC